MMIQPPPIPLVPVMFIPDEDVEEIFDDENDDDGDDDGDDATAGDEGIDSAAPVPLEPAGRPNAEPPHPPRPTL